MRTEAQKAADKRYADKNKDKQKTIGFRFKAEEAEVIEKTIALAGLTKADFLRKAVELYKQGKFN